MSWFSLSRWEAPARDEDAMLDAIAHDPGKSREKPLSEEQKAKPELKVELLRNILDGTACLKKFQRWLRWDRNLKSLDGIDRF